MITNYVYRSRFFFKAALILAIAVPGFAGVSRSIQEQYKKDYENKALYLKIPIYSEKQLINISGRNFHVEPGSGSPRYKVGDKLRVLQIDFASDEIKLKMGGIAAPGNVEIIYKFDGNLQESFPNKDVFDRALQATLTEGIKLTELDEAKRAFIEGRFDRSVREIAESASMSRDSVLKNIASLTPAYQDAQRDIENYKNKVQELSGQLSQSQAESRKLGSETKAQQAELDRLKSANAELQRKADNSASQVSKLSDDLRKEKMTSQDYQREISDLKSTVNQRTGTSRDLQKQIDSQGQQIATLKNNLDKQKEANAGLARDNAGLAKDIEDLKAKNQEKQNTIDAISSKGDSLTKKFVNLQKEKEALETKLYDLLQSVSLLSTNITEETIEGGIYSGKANVYLGKTLLGFLAWSIPNRLNNGESKSAEATFSAESINMVQMKGEEKRIRNSLGDHLKIRLDLASNSTTMLVAPEKGKPLRGIKERDHETWRWDVSNQAMQDSQLLLTARLFNRYSNEIPLFHQEHFVMASNAVRQVRSSLQPLSMAIGAVIGFLLFGIVGIFRRHKSPGSRRSSSTELSKPHSSAGPKQL